jgi:hypothetical protein
MIVDGVLQSARAARMVQYAARTTDGFALQDAIAALVTGTWDAPVPAAGKLAAIQRVTQRAVVDGVMMLAADKEASPEVRAIAEFEVGRLREAAGSRAAAATATDLKAHWLSIAGAIARYQDRGELPTLTPALKAPPGDPFGDGWTSLRLP